jgi:formylmethanofuran dehydrogenase subunit E
MVGLEAIKMGCFDYEEVECSVCHEKLVDGYQTIDNKVVCDECYSKQNKK